MFKEGLSLPKLFVSYSLCWFYNCSWWLFGPYDSSDYISEYS